MRPELFLLPNGSPVPAYETCVAAALLLGWILAMSAARRDKLPPDLAGSAYIVTLIAGLLGARGLWLLQHPSEYSGPFELIRIQAGGLSIGGGVLVGVAIGGVFVMRRGLPLWAWLDSVAPAFLAGFVVERLGAFLAGVDFGVVSGNGFLLGVEFPADSPAWIWQRRNLQGLRVPMEHSLAVHPVQLYGAAVAGIGLALSSRLAKQRVASGQIALLVLVTYVIGHMVVEDHFRIEPSARVLGPLTLGDAAGIFISLFAFAMWRARVSLAAVSPEKAQQWRGGPWSPSEGDGSARKDADASQGANATSAAPPGKSGKGGQKGASSSKSVKDQKSSRGRF